MAAAEIRIVVADYPPIERQALRQPGTRNAISRNVKSGSNDAGKRFGEDRRRDVRKAEVTLQSHKGKKDWKR